MLIFVYGTLKTGQALHDYIKLDETATLIGEASLRGYQLFQSGSGWFPFVMEGDNESIVEGEVFDVVPEMEYLLDRIEGYPDLYDKKKLTVVSNDGTEHEALTYVVTQDQLQYHIRNSKHITSGKW